MAQLEWTVKMNPIHPLWGLVLLLGHGGRPPFINYPVFVWCDFDHTSTFELNTQFGFFDVFSRLLKFHLEVMYNA